MSAFPSPLYSGESGSDERLPLSPVLGGEGWVRGLESLAKTRRLCTDPVPLTPNPSPPSTGERGCGARPLFTPELTGGGWRERRPLSPVLGEEGKGREASSPAITQRVASASDPPPAPPSAGERG